MSRDNLASYYREPSKEVAMIREVYPLVASFCDIQPLSGSMMNAVDYGKHHNRMVVNDLCNSRSPRLQLPDFMPWNAPIV